MPRKNVFSFLWFFLILYFTYLMLLLTIPYLSFKLNVEFLLTKQNIIHIKSWRYAFYTHIFTSLFVLLAGAFQFWDHFLKNYRKLHRFIGKMYVFIILLVSGPGALVMSFYANGNLISRTSFVLLSVLWILFTALAFYFALKRKFLLHRKFMIRSYALTLSAITLRLYALVLPGFIHLNAKEEYAVIAWASWTINLLLAEIIILVTRKKTVIA
ncbi:MAG: DUF2306 domain-containing protein [Bacteroidia bacterium]